MVSLGTARLEIDKYDGKGDFSIWRRKASAVLVKNKVLPTISRPEDYPESWKCEVLKEKLDSARSTLVLHLCDNV